MPAPRKYPKELRERAQRLVDEARREDPSLSLNAAVVRIGPRVGVNPDTLRGWCKQAAIDAGQRPGTTTADAATIKDLQREVRELKRANEILLAASSFFARELDPRFAVVVAFVADHRERFGVAPICRVLAAHGVPIAPDPFYAHQARRPCARSVRDGVVLAEIRRVHGDPQVGRGLYGVRKVHAQLRREGGVDGVPVSLRQVTRLMRADGLQGARRGRKFVTTRSAGTETRAPDLVRRDFTAAAPNRLWLVDFTYVPTWSGMAFTAFVSDAYSRRIVGWRTASSMPTSLPLDALEMALWTRTREGQTSDGRLDGLTHHSDAGVQYRAIRYTDRLADAGAVASIGTVGDSYDNAQAESLIGLYKLECVRHEGPWRGVDDLELATLGWVHWFNETRLHSALGHRPPVEYEQDYYRHNNPQQQPLPGELTSH